VLHDRLHRLHVRGDGHIDTTWEPARTHTGPATTLEGSPGKPPPSVVRLDHRTRLYNPVDAVVAPLARVKRPDITSPARARRTDVMVRSAVLLRELEPHTTKPSRVAERGSRRSRSSAQDARVLTQVQVGLVRHVDGGRVAPWPRIVGVGSRCIRFRRIVAW
jgi:hypothetical protein